MNNKVVFIGLTLVLAACSVGSESNISTDLSNDSLFADMVVSQTNANTATVAVALAVGGAGGSGVTLISDEQLEATVNSVVSVLMLDSSVAQTSYTSDIVLPITDQLINIDLIRRNSANIIGSEVIISPVFNLQFAQPLAASTTSTFTWQPESSATMSFVIEVTCNSSTGTVLMGSTTQSFADTGQFDVNLNTSIIDNLANVDRQQNCNASINAIRESSGQLSSGFGSGGSIVAQRIQLIENIAINPAL